MRFGSLILALVMLVVTGVIGLVTVERMKASRELVLHTYYVRGLLKDLRSEIDENHANFDLYQLSRNPDEAADLQRQAQEQLGIVQQLRQLTRDNPGHQNSLENFRMILEEDLAQLRDCVGKRSCLGSTPESKTDEMAVIFARRKTMSAMLQQMEAREAQLLDDRLQMWDRLFTRMVITLVGTFVLALVLLLYSFNLLIREIERRKEPERIEKKNAESYRMLSARILELQDVERRKIARELHDSVGQFLAGLKLNLARLQRARCCRTESTLAGGVAGFDRQSDPRGAHDLSPASPAAVGRTGLPLGGAVVHRRLRQTQWNAGGVAIERSCGTLAAGDRAGIVSRAPGVADQRTSSCESKLR